MGHSVSKETREKISKANKGKLTGNKNPAKRVEVRRKISNSKKGMIFSQKHRKNLSLAKKGTHPSINTEFKIGHKINKSELKRGTNEYKSLHIWVSKMLGKPLICRNCGETEKRIEWANKSREYKKDVTDWIELCNKCHFKYDTTT